MAHKLLVITRREYVSIVTKKSFWVATLLFPLLIVVLGGISAVSAKSAKESEAERLGEAKHIAGVDPSGAVQDAMIQPPLERASGAPPPTAHVQGGQIYAVNV